MSFLFYLSTFVTIITLLVHGLNFAARAFKAPILEFSGRSIASFCALFLCAAYGTIASAILSLAGYGGLGQYTTARAFKWCMLLFTGVWFEIEDENDYLGKTRPAVLVGNHQTELDVLMLGAVFPKWCSVTAKSSLKYWPVLGWFSKYSASFQALTSRQAMAAEA